MGRVLEELKREVALWRWRRAYLRHRDALSGSAPDVEEPALAEGDADARPGSQAIGQQTPLPMPPST